MSRLHMIESWAEALVRMAIGLGLLWIGAVERGDLGTFFEVVGAILLAAGVMEIWTTEMAARRLPRRPDMSHIHPALIACDVPVFYATTEGHTRRVADRLVSLFHEQGFSSRAVDVESSAADYIDWPHVRAAVLGASLHRHCHQRAAEGFIRAHVTELNRHPSAFFSVSLAAAAADGEERREAARLASDLPARSGWHPETIVCIAGRLAYTKYGLLTRFIMKRIARRHGAPTDTSRDHEFTNWDEVSRLADAVGQGIRAEVSHQVA